MIFRVKGDFLQEFYHSRKTFTNFVGTILKSLKFKYSLSWATLEVPLAFFEHFFFHQSLDFLFFLTNIFVHVVVSFGGKSFPFCENYFK
jgi:hypothetical protein